MAAVTNVRRRQPVNDGQGVSNGLVTFGPNPMVEARRACRLAGGVFDPASGACTLPPAPSMVDESTKIEIHPEPPKEKTDMVPYVVGAAVAGVAAWAILGRKQR